MRKRWISFALTVLVLLLTASPVFGLSVLTKTRLTDDAGLLTEEEKTALCAKLDEISERQAFDVVVVTKNGLDGKTAQEYADDFFDYNGFGQGEEYDGALLLLDMDSRAFQISTSGFRTWKP